MIRFLVGFSLAIFLLLAVAVLVIRLQPQDDDQLREVLLPNACVPPCFLGITPGETTMAQAIDLLKQHPWVGSIKRVDSERQWVVFEWSGKQPPEFNRSNWPTVEAKDGVVQQIVVPTAIPLADFWLAVGKPDWSFGNNVYGGTSYAIGYSHDNVSAEFSSPYPNRLQTLLGLKVTLFYTVRKPARVYLRPNLRDFVTGRAKSPALE